MSTFKILLILYGLLTASFLFNLLLRNYKNIRYIIIIMYVGLGLMVSLHVAYNINFMEAFLIF